MATLTSSSSSIVPANKPMKAVNLQYVDKQKLAHMSKNLSSADVTALNAMIGQAQANPVRRFDRLFSFRCGDSTGPI
jgi:DnaJ-domain-containing protein 1